MSVISAREHWDGRDGSFENVTNNRVDRKWLVKTDNKYDTPLVVGDYFRTTLSIGFQSPHPGNGSYTARNMEIESRAETPCVYDVKVTYSTEPFKSDSEEQNDEDPTARPARVTWDSENAQEFTTNDKDGKAMLNSAGDPLEPLEKDDIRWTISLTKNFANIPTWVLSTVNCVNESDVTIAGLSFPARTVKVQRLHIGELQVENNIAFYEATVELAYKKNTWDVERLDEGFNVIAGDGKVPAADKKRITIEDDDGDFQPATEAIPLDGAGGVLSDPTPDTAEHITFKVYEEADLSALPFT